MRHLNLTWIIILVTLVPLLALLIAHLAFMLLAALS